MVVGDEFEHVSDCSLWHVAVVIAPEPSGVSVLAWQHLWAVVSAANWEIALTRASLLIEVIDVQISQLDGSADLSLAAVWVGFDLAIQLVDEVVVLDLIGLVAEHPLNKVIRTQLSYMRRRTKVKNFVADSL